MESGKENTSKLAALKLQAEENPDHFKMLPEEILTKIISDVIQDNPAFLKEIRVIDSKFQSIADNYFLLNTKWVQKRMDTIPFDQAVPLARLVLNVQPKKSSLDQDYKEKLQDFANSKIPHNHVEAMEFIFDIPHPVRSRYVEYIQSSELFTKAKGDIKSNDTTNENKIILFLFNIMFKNDTESVVRNINLLDAQVQRAEELKLISEQCIKSFKLFSSLLDPEMAELGDEENFSLFQYFSGDQQYINFSNANLSGRNFLNVNLNGCNLNNAKLISTNLIKANLSNTSLINANLERTKLAKVNLSDANLTGANLTEASFLIQRLDGSVICDIEINLDNPDLPRLLEENKITVRKLPYFAERITEDVFKKGIYERYENYKAHQAAQKGGLFAKKGESQTDIKTKDATPTSPRAK